MSTPSIDKVPDHLKKYTSTQRYESYTPEDQATWRYILRQLRDFLSVHAHSCYQDGLRKTGIHINSIPKISEMDLLLQNFGWGAVPVSGFIPPAAFMEFQSLSILPIACDMRSLDHLLYTPAPDIVHEAAGHAPILIHPEYAEYLKNYAQVAKKAIISSEDLNQYEAIRKLSDIKESPYSSKEEIRLAEEKLVSVNAQISHVSEAGLLSRMNWWTAEYGLIGDLDAPKIYGAGLLSSLGESRECLKDKVKKVPLDIHCVDVSYDITEPQPQLFVTPDFKTLSEVLEDLADRLSFRRGGIHGLETALQSQAINTVELDSQIQISGLLESYSSKLDQVDFLKFSGPCQLSLSDREISGHGPKFHSQGYSSPLGPLKGLGKSLSQCSSEELRRLGLIKGNTLHLEYASGVKVSGEVLDLVSNKSGQLVVLSLKNAQANLGSQVLFEPSWGQYDIVCGDTVVSVFGGPADRKQFGELEDFVAEKVPEKRISTSDQQIFSLYKDVQAIRSSAPPSKAELEKIWQQFQSFESSSWLLGIEILELAEKFEFKSLSTKIKSHLLNAKANDSTLIEDGIRLSQTL